MDLSEQLNSINFTKKNLIRDANTGEIKQEEAKSFLSYVVLNSLSYHVDAIQFVALLNQYMTKEHKMSNAMQYEFLLNVIPKRKRFAKWAKPVKEEQAEFLMENFSLSRNVALSYLRLMTDEQINSLMNGKGGQETNRKKKKSK